MPDYFALLLSFLLVHVVCDFYLQPKSWIESKKVHRYKSWPLYFHSLLQGTALLLPSLVFELNSQDILCVVVAVTVTHYAIDLWKVTTPKGNSFVCFLVDQALHLLVLIGAVFYVVDGVQFAALLHEEHLKGIMVIVLAYLLILKPTSIVIGTVLKKYPIANPGNERASGLVAGGELIGYLERILILTLTLVGSYTAVGVVLAAKSIFRFGELNNPKDRSMTEYVLIGSLLSVVITTVAGILVRLYITSVL